MTLRYRTGLKVLFMIGALLSPKLLERMTCLVGALTTSVVSLGTERSIGMHRMWNGFVLIMVGCGLMTCSWLMGRLHLLSPTCVSVLAKWW